MDNLWHSLLANHTARNITLLVLVAIPVGNLLFELGELLGQWLGFDTHIVNRCILGIGVASVIGFGIALFRR